MKSQSFIVFPSDRTIRNFLDFTRIYALKIENPRVGGSIPPLGTISQSSLTGVFLYLKFTLGSKTYPPTEYLFSVIVIWGQSKNSEFLL